MIDIDGVSLYYRDIGTGEPVIVLHGGPDFDHSYFLPDLDRLADAYRLIYYDQRGRGRSVDGVSPEAVSLASEIDDLDAVRRHFGLDAVALLGHSWGAVLALAYAARHATRVSRLILMNPAPASAADLALTRQAYLDRLGPEMDRQRDIMASDAYEAGDPHAVTARYRIHFKSALKRSEDYERLMTVMQAAFLRQGPDGILKARAAEDQLLQETWHAADGYDLAGALGGLHVPTLVITGDHDFIPVEVAEHIAESLPDALLATIPDCGHFAYLECPDDVRGVLDYFWRESCDRGP